MEKEIVTKNGKKIKVVLGPYADPSGLFTVEANGEAYQAQLQNWSKYGPGIFILGPKAYAQITEEDYGEIQRLLGTLPPKPKGGYEHLMEKLPPIPTFKTTGNEKRFRELKEQASAIKFFDGPEMDGVNLAVASQRESLLSEARKHCPHEIFVNYEYSYTADARKLIRRICECPKCGLTHVDEVAEEISEEAIWR